MPSPSPQACMADFTAAMINRDMAAALALLTDEVVFFYSNGMAPIVGKQAFSELMSANWKVVEDYAYDHANHVWVAQSDTAAAVIYSFSWTGKARGQAVGGAGRATRVFRNDGTGWRVAHEHLSAGDWTV